MPHVIVKLWPGKSEKQKTQRAERITKDVMDVLNYGEESVSVAFEEVSALDWAEKPDIVNTPSKLYMLRHTCAMVVLQATQDIRKVSLWLGHTNLTTTEVYVRADPTEKLEAIEAVVPPSLRKGRFRPPDKLLELLKGKP